MDIIVLHGSYRQVLPVPEEGRLSISDQLEIFMADGVLSYQYQEHIAPMPSEFHRDGIHLYPKPQTIKHYSLAGRQRLVVGPRVASELTAQDPQVTVSLERTPDNRWHLTNLGKPIYINNRLSDSDGLLPFGAELAFENSLIKIFPHEVWVYGPVFNNRLLETPDSRYSYYEDYPDYHRSPRLIYRSSEDRVTITAPQAEPNKPRNELLKAMLPPLVMVGVVIVISIFQPRGLYILMSVVMSIMTSIFSVQNYIKTKREYKQSLKDRIEAYHAYLADKAIELRELALDQRQGQHYHYPALPELDQLAQELSSRIYEKTPQQFDFLTYRLGLGRVPTTYTLDYSNKERSGVKDPLEVEGFTLYQTNKELDDMPVVASLKQGPVGYVGERPLVIEQLQLLINQLVLFHSYHDLRIITVLPESEKDQWQWLRWLPHAALPDINVRGLVYDQRTRDQVLNSLTQIIKSRQLAQEDTSGSQELRFSPHYLILITDETLILDHAIMEYFNDDPTDLGFSLVFVQDVMRALSENVKTVIRIKDGARGELVMEEGELKNHEFLLDHFPEGYDKERITRRLAPLNHLETLKSSIPDQVTFLDMYGVERVEDLKVTELWQQHAPHKSLSVPLGLRGPEDYVRLDLHERAHGPHGLIAGTTGSGKSELIQSYILSLAVNFHPHDVGFLLIDYKGGGMADLFKGLPHVLGTITNLDGNQAMRAMASIKAENRRRQRLFAKVGVNHIHAYQKKYKNGEVTEPLPHLIIISDEFAELKNEQPEFISELVSTARIGRSLGVNLILATQKPSGVVNDQIWANSNFRLALKVADKADSQEMLHTPDAATITQAGRAYLQVGNNEVYELFQSAWSGADYAPDQEDQGTDDVTISLVNELGQYQPLNQDLSGLDQVDDLKEVPSQLSAIVSHIKELATAAKLRAVPQPWLPPLKERIYLETLLDNDTLKPYDAVFGVVDIPDEQSQISAIYNPTTDGNLLLLSQPGMGKSTFIQTLLMSLAERHTPEEVQAYLLDFGTNGLMPLRELPHATDFIASDDDEKITKFIARMTDLVAERKAFLKNQNVANSTMYRDLGHTFAQILIVVDNYDGAKDNPRYEDIDRTIQLLARDGNALGITVIMTAGRMSALRGPLMTTMRERLALRLTEDSESRNFVGRHTYAMDDIPGRGVMRVDDPEIVQIALPVAGETDQEVLMTLRNRVKEIDRSWTGERPNPIPLVPDVLYLDDYRKRHDVRHDLEHQKLPIGLSTDLVEDVSLELSQLKHIAYISDDDAHMVNMTKHLTAVTTLFPNSSVMLFDVDGYYDALATSVKTYVTDSQEMPTRLVQLILEIERRETSDEPSKTWFGIIPNFEAFVDQSQMTPEQLRIIFERGAKVGMYLIAGSSPAYLLVNANVIPKFYRQNASHFLLGIRLSDQNVLPKTYNPKEEYLATDMIYLHNRRKDQLLKITIQEEEE